MSALRLGMRTSTRFNLALAVLALACDPHADANVPEEGPPAIAGGTLRVSADGSWAIASDPARAAIHIVDLRSSEAVGRIDLDRADEPGRIGEDLEGGLHVVLRRAGQVATIDPLRVRIERRTPVCRAPRGIDVDPADGNLVVACAEGELVRLTPAGEIVRRVKLETDLRDVVAQDGRLYVSRFRSAEVLIVEGDHVTARVTPPGSTSPIGERVPTVAWRMRPLEGGGVLLIHQESVATQLGDPANPGGVYYGGECDVGIVRSVVTQVGPDLHVTTIGLDSTSLAVDGVRTGAQTYVAAAAEPGAAIDTDFFRPRNGLRRVGGSGRVGCSSTEALLGEARAVTAVDRLPDGRVIAQYRDPAELVVVNGPTIRLEGGPVIDFGHALFHEAAGTGATCASCHPEGGDDGHVWAFDIGHRRTQTTAGGILATAPFHWEGDVPDMPHVLGGTLVGRMGGSMPREREVEAFARWVDGIPAVAGERVSEDVAARGQTLFDEAGCASCHSGPLRTNNRTLDVGTGGSFQVPALYEVIYRAPYFHDGSAGMLEDAIAGHGGGSELSPTERNELAAYLRSL